MTSSLAGAMEPEPEGLTMSWRQGARRRETAILLNLTPGELSAALM